MDARSWAREMALYNRWQNAKLYRICDRLADAERTADRGMFFASIHHTLDHILMVDERLLGYALTAEMPGPFEPAKLVHADYAALREARTAFDARLLGLIEDLDDNWFDERIPFFGRDRRLPRQLFLVQMFNHATHHRSQVTAELHRMGVDYGSTDLPFNPDSQF